MKKKVFESHGYPCVIVEVEHSGHLCGYVGIPKDHPLHGVRYSQYVPWLASFGDGGHTCYCCGSPSASPEAAFSVYGGITFSENKAPDHGETGRWWFGFDCAHAGDLLPKSMFRSDRGVYRDEDFITAECQKLAAQLAECAKPAVAVKEGE